MRNFILFFIFMLVSWSACTQIIEHDQPVKLNVAPSTWTANDSIVVRQADGLLVTRPVTTLPASGGGSGLVYAENLTFNWSSSTAGSPSAGQIRLNNASPASATEIYISYGAGNGADITDFVSLITDGAALYLQSGANEAIYATYTVSGAPTTNVGWISLPVTYKNGAGSFSGTTQFSYSNAPGSVVESDPVHTLWLTDPIVATATELDQAVNLQQLTDSISAIQGTTAIGRYDEGNGDTFYPVGYNRTFTGIGGAGALDLSFNDTNGAYSPNQGGIGSQSLSLGFNIQNEGYGALMIGEDARIGSSGTYSIAQGYGNNIAGYTAVGIGTYHTSTANYSVLFGHSNTATSGGSNILIGNGLSDASSSSDRSVILGEGNKEPNTSLYFDSNNIALQIGMGEITGNGSVPFVRTNPRDALLVYRDRGGANAALAGAIGLPETTLANIATWKSNGWTQVAATVEYVDQEVANAGGGGDVTKVGTPADNEMAVWTGDGTIEGESKVTYDSSTKTFEVNNTGIDPYVRVDAWGLDVRTQFDDIGIRLEPGGFGEAKIRVERSTNPILSFVGVDEYYDFWDGLGSTLFMRIHGSDSSEPLGSVEVPQMTVSTYNSEPSTSKLLTTVEYLRDYVANNGGSGGPDGIYTYSATTPYTTVSAQNGYHVVLSGSATSVTLDDAGVSVDEQFTFYNKTGGDVTWSFGSGDSAYQGTPANIPDGQYGWATLEAANTWSVQVGEGGGGGSGTIGGSIADNQIAVGSSVADEIEGGNTFTWNGSQMNLTPTNAAVDLGGGIMRMYLNGSTGYLQGLTTSQNIQVGVGTSAGITLSSGSGGIKNVSTGTFEFENDAPQILLDGSGGSVASSGTITMLDTGSGDMRFELTGTADYSFYAGSEEQFRISDNDLVTVLNDINMSGDVFMNSTNSKIGYNLSGGVGATSSYYEFTSSQINKGLYDSATDYVLTDEFYSDLLGWKFGVSQYGTETDNFAMYYGGASGDRFTWNLLDEMDFDGTQVQGVNYELTQYSSTGTIASTDVGTIIEATSGSALTLTIPDTLNEREGAQITIVAWGTGTATIATSGTATINGSTSITIDVAGQASNVVNSVMLYQRGGDNSDDWVAVGAYTVN